VTRTLRGRLVFVLGAVVAAACVLLVALALLGSAVLLRREQDRTLRSMAVEQCEGISSEAKEQHVDLPAGARVYFSEGEVAGIRLELLDRQGSVLAANGELDGWGTSGGRFRLRSVDCGDSFTMRAVARDVLTESSVRRVGGTLMAVFPIAVALGMVLGGIAIAKALKPLDELEQAAARLTAASPLALGVGARPLEIARLERSFDGLLERLGAALARERRFTQEASHEIRTPLTVIRARVERLAAARTDGERGDHVVAVLRELGSLETLVEALLLLSRAEDAPLPRDPVNLCDLARSAARRQGLVDGATGTPVAVEAPDEILVRGSEELLDRAIGNVVENARKFAGPAGRIRLRIEARSGRGVISVADDGPGIAEGTRAQVFERFYRDPSQRQASDGAGLGLAVVRAIAVRHGGDVTADRSDLGGAELRIDLPLL
jgi:signal transduction histidine kinase